MHKLHSRISVSEPAYISHYTNFIPPYYFSQIWRIQMGNNMLFPDIKREGSRERVCRALENIGRRNQNLVVPDARSPSPARGGCGGGVVGAWGEVIDHTFPSSPSSLPLLSQLTGFFIICWVFRRQPPFNSCSLFFPADDSRRGFVLDFVDGGRSLCPEKPSFLAVSVLRLGDASSIDSHRWSWVILKRLLA